MRRRRWMEITTSTVPTMFNERSGNQEPNGTNENVAFTPFFGVEPHTVILGSRVLHESLPSWLYRFCTKNGFLNLSSLSRSYETTRTTASDAPLDLDAAIAGYAQLTGAPSEVVRSLMLADTLGVLQGGLKSLGSRWLLRSFSSRKYRSIARHVICPLCVGASEDAAWLQSWRLATSTQCPIHGVLLLENCPGCNLPFQIHGWRNVPLDQCESCYLPIHSMPVETCGDSNRAPTFAMHVGQNNPGNLPVAPGSEKEWWRGIRKILNLIEDPKRALVLAQATLPMEFRDLLLEVSRHDKQSFEAWPLRRRHCTLRFIDWLTCEWPARFIDFFKVFGRDRAGMLCLVPPLPDWLFHARNIASAQGKGKLPRRRLLLAPKFARLSIPVYSPRKKLPQSRLSNPMSSRWSPQYATHVVRILDKRLLTMQGPLSARARFLRGALTLILEHSAPVLLILPTRGCTDPRMALAIQTVQAWSECLQHWHPRSDRAVKTALAQPTVRLSDRRIAKMLEPEDEDAQLPLFAWTVQPGHGYGQSTP